MPKFYIGLTAIIILVIFLIIPLAFFLLLNSKTGSGFGLKEISFSIVIAIVATLFLLWNKNFMENRPYIGLIIGLVVLVLVEYSLFFRFKGPTTITFAIIIALVVITFLGFFFFKFKKRELASKNSEEEFNDNL